MFKELEAKIQQDLIALGKEIWADLNADVAVADSVIDSKLERYLSCLHTRTAPEFEAAINPDGSFTVYVPRSEPLCHLTIVATRR
ncbi:hypothetical protein D3C80_1224830 [compost metagenome]